MSSRAIPCQTGAAPCRGGLRFVHRFTRGELTCLAETGGFIIQLDCAADGEGGRLSHFQV